MENRSTLLDATVEYVAASGQPVDTTLDEVDHHRLSRALPIRKPPSYRAQRHYPGLFWSATTGDHVTYESRLELARLWYADFSRRVTWIASQPMWLRGWDGEAFRQHVPDLLLTLSDGQFQVVDVKLAKFVNHPRARAIFAWTSRICSAAGWKYEVWTENDYDPVELANIQSLSLGRRWRTLSHRKEHPHKRDDVVGRTLCNLAEGPRSRTEVLANIWSGQWAVDLSRPLSWQSEVIEVLDCEPT